jgi:hypothetical protein
MAAPFRMNLNEHIGHRDNVDVSRHRCSHLQREVHAVDPYVATR